MHRRPDGSFVPQLRIEVHVVSEPRPGVWCQTCSLPSGVEFDIAVTNADTLVIFGRGVAARCYDCGEPIPFEPRGSEPDGP